MKAITKGAVYYCSQCHIARKLYAEELARDKSFKINGHRAAEEYNILYNRPVIVLDNIDIGNAVHVIPITHTIPLHTPAIKISEFPFDTMYAAAGDPRFKFEEGYAAIEWVSTVNTRDLWKMLGFVENEEMEQIDSAIKYIYGYGQKPEFWYDWENSRVVDVPDPVEEIQKANDNLNVNHLLNMLHDAQEQIKSLTEKYNFLVGVPQETSHNEEKELQEEEQVEVVDEVVHPSIPSYVIGDASHLKCDPQRKISDDIISAISDSTVQKFLMENPMTYAQAASIATITDPAIGILLGTSLPMSRRIKDACSNIIDSICDCDKSSIKNLLRKHQIIFMLADKEGLKNEPISVICEKYNVSKKKANEFRNLARAS